MRRPGAYYIARRFPPSTYHEVTREAVLAIDYESQVHPNEYNEKIGIKVVYSSNGNTRAYRGIYVPLELE